MVNIYASYVLGMQLPTIPMRKSIGSLDFNMRERKCMTTHNSIVGGSVSNFYGIFAGS